MYAISYTYIIHFNHRITKITMLRRTFDNVIKLLFVEILPGNMTTPVEQEFIPFHFAAHSHVSDTHDMRNEIRNLFVS